MSLKLPDAEALLRDLGRQMRPNVGANTALVGIHTGGVWLARRLHADLGIVIPLGSLDVTFYRDDYERIGLHRDAKRSELPFEVEGRDIVLVDDVLYTGRTIRAAMNELFDFGRPAAIRLAAMIDRGGRELPIAAQFIGAVLDVPKDRMLALEQAAEGRLELSLQEWC